MLSKRLNGQAWLLQRLQKAREEDPSQGKPKEATPMETLKGAKQSRDLTSQQAPDFCSLVAVILHFKSCLETGSQSHGLLTVDSASADSSTAVQGENREAGQSKFTPLTPERCSQRANQQLERDPLEEPTRMVQFGIGHIS